MECLLVGSSHVPSHQPQFFRCELTALEAWQLDTLGGAAGRPQPKSVLPPALAQHTHWSRFGLSLPPVCGPMCVSSS